MRRFALILIALSIACGKDSPAAPSTPATPPPPPPPALYRVSGVVTDGTNNRPLGATSVTVSASNNPNRFVLTDSTGAYAFPDVAAGRLSLVFTKVGYGSSFNAPMLTGDLRFDVTLNAVPPNVEYRITGSARRCSATYANSTGGTDQRAVTIPFSYSWYGARTGDFLYMSCQIDQGNDTGSITVGIYKNGSLYRSGSAFGFPNIATASGSY